MTSADAAQPTTADKLLALETEHATRFGGTKHSTGCGSLDEMLAGMDGEGVERGVVVGVSAEGSEGEGVLMSLRLLASTVVRHLSPFNATIGNLKAKPKASIIDTTGSFPLSLLATVLESCILEYQSLNDGDNHEIHGQEGEGLNEKVQRCLEMVAVSRVFDIEGLWEVLSEIKEGHRPRAHNITCLEKPGVSLDIVDSEADNIRSTISSSQPDPTAANEEGIEIIIVDNMTQIINELLSTREKSDAYNLLNTLSLTMHTLSRRQNILTLLHNSVVAVNPHHLQYQKPQTTKSRPLTASLFSSNAYKPALGTIFEQFTDLHIFISALPKRRRDAEILAGGGRRTDIEQCWVVEILKDECPRLGIGGGGGVVFGGREGMWRPVDIAGGIRFVPAFENKEEG